ncbi:MAG: enoyl-CoA hydratase-related protein [Pseudomonadota bacterium]
MTDLILTESCNGILIVKFNRADKKNAITNDMWMALQDVFERARMDDSVRCLLLAAEGNHFCAGVDLASMSESEQGTEHPFEAAARAVVEFDKPLVAAATGYAVGGGATVLFHADLVYVGESLRLRLPFASLGLVPEWGSSYMLQANIGAQRAAELFYTARWVDAKLAQEYGMAAAVVPDDELYAQALTVAQEIGQWPLSSLREIKRCLRAHHLPEIDRAINQEQAAMNRQLGSPANIEAMTAFLEKRSPDFSNL